MELEGRNSMKSDINGAAYLMSWGSEMASLSNIPSVMYLSLVAALEQSSIFLPNLMFLQSPANHKIVPQDPLLSPQVRH